MAKLDAGNRPGQFGGYPGQFSGVDHGEPLPGHLERQSAVETDEADEASTPRYGTAGERVQ